MQELLTVITRKGQITLPAPFRSALNLKEGDKVSISRPDPGSETLMIRPVRSVAEATYGSVPPRPEPFDVREMREAFEQAVAEEAMRSLSRCTESS